MAQKLPVQKVAKMLGDNVATVYKRYYSLTQNDKEDIVETVLDINNNIENKTRQ